MDFDSICCQEILRYTECSRRLQIEKRLVATEYANAMASKGGSEENTGNVCGKKQLLESKHHGQLFRTLRVKIILIDTIYQRRNFKIIQNNRDISPQVKNHVSVPC